MVPVSGRATTACWRAATALMEMSAGFYLGRRAARANAILHHGRSCRGIE